MTEKESLLKIIRQEGHCKGLHCLECALFTSSHKHHHRICRCRTIGSGRYSSKKKLAINTYLELYGKDSLVEELI